MKRSLQRFLTFLLILGLTPPLMADELRDAGSGSGKDSSGDRLSRKFTSDEDLQGVETQLTALYAQRDAIVNGLSNLGYDVCMKSRFARTKTLTQFLSQKRGKLAKPMTSSLTYECPRNSKKKCLPPDPNTLYGAKIILPLLNQPHIHKTEFKKTQVINRLLSIEKEGDVRTMIGKVGEEKKGPGFHGKFFNRISCLKGPAIMRGCQLLSDDKKIKDPELKRLKALLDKRPNFKARFDQKRACEVAESKATYIEKLKPVQEEILVLEARLKDSRKEGGDDEGDDEDDGDGDGDGNGDGDGDGDGDDDGNDNSDDGDKEHPIGDGSDLSKPTDEPNKDLTCTRVGGSSTEICVNKKQKSFRCESKNGVRKCKKIKN